MKYRLIATLTVGLLALTACTPEEIAAVEAHYRAAVATAQAERESIAVARTPEVIVTVDQSPVSVADTAVPPQGVGTFNGPGWEVTTTCDAVTVVLTGWAGVTDVLYDDGSTFAIVGAGAMVAPLRLDDAGNGDGTYPVGHVANGEAWGWTVLINGPGLSVGGMVDC